METFRIQIKSGKQFTAAAENISANDLKGLANDIATYIKKTVTLIDGLKNKGLKGLQSSTIGKNTDTTIEIVYLVDNIKLSLSFKRFGTFVRVNSIDTIASVIFDTAEYQQEVGYLFTIKK